MKNNVKEKAGIRGCFRIQINEKGKIVGDSGWHDNLVVNDGIDMYIARSFAGVAGSLQVSHITLGTGGVPASSDTALAGEQIVSSRRGAVTTAFSQRAASNGTATMQFTATFASSSSFITASANISNIALVNSSSAGTIMAGNTYASSALATNQNINVTYQIRIN